MSSHRRASSFFISPSTWQSRVKRALRPAAIKQIIFFTVLAALIIPIYLLSGHNIYSVTVAADDAAYPYPLHDTVYFPRPPHDILAHHHHVDSPGPAVDDTVQSSPPSSSPEPSTTNTVLNGAPEAIAFSFVMFSTDSAAEGAILIKSILMYTSKPIDFHIICDVEARSYLERRLALVTRPRHNVRVRFYQLTLPNMLDRLAREGSIATDHSAGIPGLMKLFIHEILPASVKKSIFIDTDAFFISDPVLLWQQFDKFLSNTAISMPTHPDQNAVEWHLASNICSCIMLLDLEKLRQLRLMDSSIYRSTGDGTPALAPPAFTSMFGPPGASGHYEGVKLGDQGYWWAIVSYNQSIFQHLNYDWEISSCLVDMYMTGLGRDDATEADELGVQIHTLGTPHEGQVVLPKMLHFNCLDGASTYYDWDGWSDPGNGLVQRWGPSVKYHLGYKWLWLNQGEENTTSLSMETIEEIKFADELLASNLGSS